MFAQRSSALGGTAEHIFGVFFSVVVVVAAAGVQRSYVSRVCVLGYFIREQQHGAVAVLGPHNPWYTAPNN